MFVWVPIRCSLGTSVSYFHLMLAAEKGLLSNYEYLSAYDSFVFVLERNKLEDPEIFITFVRRCSYIDRQESFILSMRDIFLGTCRSVFVYFCMWFHTKVGLKKKTYHSFNSTRRKTLQRKLKFDREQKKKRRTIIMAAQFQFEVKHVCRQYF